MWRMSNVPTAQGVLPVTNRQAEASALSDNLQLSFLEINHN